MLPYTYIIYFYTESGDIISLFNDALMFAIQKHDGQKRKFSDAPYILHPFEAASIVSTMTSDENVLAAALLHDTVEDSDATLDEIEKKFGRRVALLVMTETEDKCAEKSPEDSWLARKEQTILTLQKTKDRDVRILWLGDKLSNMRSYYRIYRKLGNEMWQRFHQKDPKIQAWYYRSIAKALSELSEYEAYDEYVDLMNKIFSDLEI